MPTDSSRLFVPLTPGVVEKRRAYIARFFLVCLAIGGAIVFGLYAYNSLSQVFAKVSSYAPAIVAPHDYTTFQLPPVAADSVLEVNLYSNVSNAWDPDHHEPVMLYYGQDCLYGHNLCGSADLSYNNHWTKTFYPSYSQVSYTIFVQNNSENTIRVTLDLTASISGIIPGVLALIAAVLLVCGIFGLRFFGLDVYRKLGYSIGPGPNDEI